jgi:hypothetical protein
MIPDKKKTKAKQVRRVKTLECLYETLDDLEASGFYYSPNTL